MKNYRSYLLAGAAALSLGFVSAAQAADPIIYEQPPVMLPAAMYDWSGFYAGVTGGYGWGDLDYGVTAGGADVGSFDLDGAFIGGVAGYNWQSGNIVFGVEGDLVWSGIDGSTLASGGAATVTNDVEWMASVRGRVGYALDNVLPYLTAGVALAGNEVTFGPFSDSNTHVGWTAGLGVELGVTENVSASLEYRYTDFGSEDYSDGGFGASGSISDLHTVGAAIKWRFN